MSVAQTGAEARERVRRSSQQPWAASKSKADSTYCATLRALQPGQLVHAMPASFR